MVDIINSVVEFIGQVSPFLIYIVLFFIAYLENIVPPVPGDVIVAFGGYLITIGSINGLGLWLGTVITSVLGFMTMYRMGSYLGGSLLASTSGAIKQENGLENGSSEGFLRSPRNALAKLILRFANPSYLHKGSEWMRSYGQWVVVSNRFLAGTRSVIALTAGASKLSIWPTVLSSSVSSMLWNGVLIYGGWWLGDNWRRVGVYLEAYSQLVLLLLALLGLIGFIYVRRKKQG
jgi:membrane protein DedA with SNARE-associated domain